MVVKSLKALRHTWDSPDGSVRWRGGVLQSLGATATIKLFEEAHVVRTYHDVSLSVLAEGLTIGDPIIARVTGDPFEIAEVRWSRAAPGAPSDQAGAVARGEMWAGTVPYSMSGEDDFWWRA